MIRRLIAAASLSLAAPVLAQTPPPAAPAPPAAAAPDYSAAASWLCRPGKADVCTSPLDVTSVAASGALTKTTIPMVKDAPVDCFYVYPTVSTDPGGNSDMVADPAEKGVALIQFAAFRSVCRTYAPLYRQVTLAALRAVLTGAPTNADRIMAYSDVASAWASYLARDNQGRGVILIGHSQGSGIIKALLAREIEGKPVAARVIAAYIPGNNVLVPTGADAGGDLKVMPLCRAATQTGCVVAYVSFRDGEIPPPDSRFGRSPTPGMAVGCTNPAALGGGRASLSALLPASSAIVDNSSAQPAWATGAKIDTRFVAVPGLLSAECRSLDGATFLSVRTDADPADPRTDRIAGDVVNAGQVRPEWGLHLIDVNETLGDLVTLAKTQSAAWLAKK